MHSNVVVRSCRAVLAAVVALAGAAGAHAQTTIDPAPLMTTQDVGMPSTGLDVGVALGDGGVLAFRASSGLSGGVWARTGSGVRLTLQGNNFGVARNLCVNSSGVVGFVKPGGVGTGDALMSGEAVLGGSVITIFGSSFGMSSIGPAKLRDSNLFSFLSTSASNGARGAYSMPRGGGSIITIRGIGTTGLVDDNDCDDRDGDYFTFRARNSSSEQGIYARARAGIC
jgi:hypothetical protein